MGSGEWGKGKMGMEEKKRAGRVYACVRKCLDMGDKVEEVDIDTIFQKGQNGVLFFLVLLIYQFT